MKPMPDSVKDHISNAHYYLKAAAKFPPPTQNAAHILLLLISWENIVIADSELSAWATRSDVNPQVYKDHAHKYKDAPEIHRIILGPSGTKPREIRFSSGRDFAELRLACQYGSNTESKKVSTIFNRDWDADDFQRALVSKIGWIEALIGIYEKELAKARTV